MKKYELKDIMAIAEEIPSIIDWNQLIVEFGEVLPIDFILKHRSYFDWYELCGQFIPERVLLLFKDELKDLSRDIDWVHISKYYEMSDEFIIQMKDFLYWDVLSEYQILSESLIREMEDYVEWDIISQHQDLSDEFREEFSERLNRYHW